MSFALPHLSSYPSLTSSLLTYLPLSYLQLPSSFPLPAPYFTLPFILSPYLASVHPFSPTSSHLPTIFPLLLQPFFPCQPLHSLINFSLPDPLSLPRPPLSSSYLSSPHLISPRLPSPVRVSPQSPTLVSQHLFSPPFITPPLISLSPLLFIYLSSPHLKSRSHSPLLSSVPHFSP